MKFTSFALALAAAVASVHAQSSTASGSAAAPLLYYWSLALYPPVHYPGRYCCWLQRRVSTRSLCSLPRVRFLALSGGPSCTTSSPSFQTRPPRCQRSPLKLHPACLHFIYQPGTDSILPLPPPPRPTGPTSPASAPTPPSSSRPSLASRKTARPPRSRPRRPSSPRSAVHVSAPFLT